MVAPLQLQDTSGFPGHLPQPQRHDVKSKKPTEVLQTLWFSPSLSGQGFRSQTQAIPAPQSPFPTPQHLLGDERKEKKWGRRDQGCCLCSEGMLSLCLLQKTLNLSLITEQAQLHPNQAAFYLSFPNTKDQLPCFCGPLLTLHY